MFNKNGILRAVAVIGIITMMALTVLPGCSFVGKADIPEETTNDPFALDDTLNTQGCPVCQSTNFTGPDDKGFFTCGDCGATWGTNDGNYEVYDKDGNLVQLPGVSGGSNGGSSNGGSNGGSSGGSNNRPNGGSNGGSNNRPNGNTNTNIPSTDKEQVNNTKPAPTMKEIIEAIQSVAKENITIDANGNLTIKNDEGKDTGLFGFKYSTTEKCFITAEDAWQRQYGYNEIYDASAPVLAISYDTMRVYFDYDGLQWMIQYWKGQYGLVLVGAEIGIYNRPETSSPSSHYNCADDETKLLQSMNVYQCGTADSNEYKLILSRNPSYTWWCTGFVPGTLAFAKYNVNADYTNRLRVDSKLTLKTPEMAQAFIEGLRKVDTIYNNTAGGSTRRISFIEMTSAEEYETRAAKAKFFLEEDGVTVRVCWR